MFGPVTIARERQLRMRGIRLRVFAHGDDVTDRCRYADDTPGREVAVLLRRNVHGHFHLDEDGGAAVEIAEHDVRMVREVLEP